MRNTKLYSILEQFDKYEQNRCRKFLQSPYFNRDKTLINLFDFLVADINNGKNGSSEKEDLWKQLSLENSYDDTRFRKYLSDLTKLVEDFLSQQIYENNQLQKASYLLQALEIRKLEKSYKSSIRNAKTALEKNFQRPATFYYYQYLIEANCYQLSGYDTKRAERSNIEEVSNNLDNFYLAEKLRILCGVLSSQTIAAHNYNIILRDTLIQHIEKNIESYKLVPPVSLYYQIYLTIIEPNNEGHYFGLKELLNKYALLFPIQDAVNQFYVAAQNYCIRKLNQGNQLFLKEVVDIYKDMIKKIS